MKKRILALVLTVVLLVGGAVSAFAADECAHESYELLAEAAATCGFEGYRIIKCDECGVQREVFPATGEHDFVDGTCTVCGMWDETEETECEHNYVVVKEEPGYAWYECTICGAEKNGETETECTHEETYTDTLEANCSEEGYVKTICTDCGETVSEETLPKNDNHFFYNGTCMKCGTAEVCAHEATYTDTLEANCSAEGSKKVICKDCGETVSEETLPKNDNHFFYNGTCMKCGTAEVCAHEATYTDTFEANCSAEGYVKVFCKDCNELLSETVLEKNDIHFFYNGVCQKCGKEEVCDHDMVVVKELAPTCIEAGYVWQECSKCGYELNYEVGEATGAHNYEVVKELAPNCIESGYVWKECTVCGAEKNHEVGEPNGVHNYEVVKELAPTCKEPGYVWKECTVCGAEKNHEVGEANGEHNYVVVKEEAGTCTVPGYVWKECTVCGAEKNHETVVDANAHNYEIVKELAPTCKEPGYVWKECVECGAEKNHEVGEANGEHSGETYVDIFEANCSKEGYKKTLCKECDEVLSEEVLPKNDAHAFHNGVCLLCGAAEAECEHDGETYVDVFEATCSKEGYKKVFCKECDELLSEEVLPVNDNHAFYNGKCLLCGIDEEAAEEPEVPATPVDPEEPEVPTTPVDPEEPADPTTPVEPETPAEDAELDDVPKTGDQNPVLFVSMICLASIAGVAFIVTKKRRTF